MYSIRHVTTPPQFDGSARAAAVAGARVRALRHFINRHDDVCSVWCFINVTIQGVFSHILRVSM